MAKYLVRLERSGSAYITIDTDDYDDGDSMTEDDIMDLAWLEADDDDFLDDYDGTVRLQED